MREWIGEHRPELSAEQQQYLGYLVGYELGDVAIDANYSVANAFGGEALATVDGQSFFSISDLAAITGQAANIGAYELYGNLGSNPLVINGEGRAWYNLDFNGMRDTDDISEWAEQNGYTSVVFENISDYGDPSNVKVFFNPEQVKSADPVTYDDNGNVIPLSERFNNKKNDIRFRVTKKESPKTATQTKSVTATGISDDSAAKISKLKEIYNSRPSKSVFDMSKIQI